MKAIQLPRRNHYRLQNLLGIPLTMIATGLAVQLWMESLPRLCNAKLMEFPLALFVFLLLALISIGPGC